MLEVTDSNFDTIAVTPGLVVIDCWSPWCSPCNRLNPVIKTLADKNTDITIGKLNTVENLDVTARFRIDGIPTILFFKDGNLVKRILGYHNEQQLQSFIDELKK